MRLPIAIATNFSTLDWVIVVVYLAGTVVAGLYANRYIKDMADYIVAGRSLKSFISVATMLGSEIGLVTVMYAAQKGFTGGFAAFHIGLAAGVGCFVVGLTPRLARRFGLGFSAFYVDCPGQFSSRSPACRGFTECLCRCVARGTPSRLFSCCDRRSVVRSGRNPDDSGLWPRPTAVGTFTE